MAASSTPPRTPRGAAAATAAASSTPPAPAPPAPAVEPTYPVEIRLQNAAMSGEMVYHVNWRASTVRRYLTDQLVKVRVPLRTHFGHTATPNAVRYVQLDAIAEVIIYNWPGDGGDGGDDADDADDAASGGR